MGIGRTVLDEQEQEADDLEDELKLSTSPVVRSILVVAGTISVALGLIGVLLPLVPTTPFLLLAAGCYARSSERFYRWLLTNRWFGKYIRDWRRGAGIPLKAKITATVMLVVTLGSSIVLFVPILWVKVLLAAIGATVIAYLWRLPTAVP